MNSDSTGGVVLAFVNVERGWGVTATVCDAFAGVGERRVKSVGVAGIHSGVNGGGDVYTEVEGGLVIRASEVSHSVELGRYILHCVTGSVSAELFPVSNHADLAVGVGDLEFSCGLDEPCVPKKYRSHSAFGEIDSDESWAVHSATLVDDEWGRFMATLECDYVPFVSEGAAVCIRVSRIYGEVHSDRNIDPELFGNKGLST